MGNGISQPEGSVNQLDADAFCVVCSSVNPEGTLICKTCGNNLRDQKAKRVAGIIAVDTPILEEERLNLLPKILVVLGILLVLWTALNLGDIEEYLVGAQAADRSSAAAFWTGPDRAIYNEMLQELDASPLSEAEKAAAQDAVGDGTATGQAGGVYQGHYLLIRGGGIPGELGEAIVRQVDDQRVVFVARVNRGRAEVRGEGVFEGGSRIAARDTAGLMINGRYYGAVGFAAHGGPDWYNCYGSSELSDVSYGAVAIRVR